MGETPSPSQMEYNCRYFLMTLHKQIGEENFGKNGMVFILYRVLCFTGHWPIPQVWKSLQLTQHGLRSKVILCLLVPERVISLNCGPWHHDIMWLPSVVLWEFNWSPWSHRKYRLNCFDLQKISISWQWPFKDTATGQIRWPDSGTIK